MRVEPLVVLIAICFTTQALGNVVNAPALGTASSFGLLGGTVSNTGVSLISGNVGATTAVTGFPPGLATGTIYAAPSDPTVTQAYSDFLAAYNQTFSDVFTPPTQSVADLTVNRTFNGGNVYNFPITDVVSTAGITLTFDAQADSSEVFIIKTALSRNLTGGAFYAAFRKATKSVLVAAMRCALSRR